MAGASFGVGWRRGGGVSARRCSFDESECSSGASDSLVGSLLVDSLLGFRLRKGPRFSNVSRETFVSISHYIAILVSCETPQGGRGCSQRPRCLSRLSRHSSAAVLRLPFAAPLLFWLPFPVTPHPSFRLSFPAPLRFPPPVASRPDPPTPRPPLLSAPSLGPSPSALVQPCTSTPPENPSPTSTERGRGPSPQVRPMRIMAPPSVCADE